MKFRILIVEDETNIRNGLSVALELDGYAIYLAADGEKAIPILEREDIDLVISDLKMPAMGGEELLKKITSSYPTIPVIILTGHGTIESAVSAMRDGAFDFLTKPVNLAHLSMLVKRALSNRSLMLQHRTLQDEVNRLRLKDSYPGVISKSSGMRKVMDVVAQVSNSKASVLITGESGVGKEVIADIIHQQSGRRDNPMIKVHCAALTDTLLESELFGHEKGAFTGAVATKRGRFEMADGGTILLDEIGEISQSTQVKILRILQERRFERVGGEKTLEVDIRIVSATNRNLLQEIQEGNFREDLYYRLNVVNIDIPPLRERKEDIFPLILSCLKEFAEENQKEIDGISAKARGILVNYNWPGNIRELRNCMESAVVMCKGSVIQPDDLPPTVLSAEGGSAINIPVGTSLSEAERMIIQETLSYEKGNKSSAARVLGIGRKTLHRKLDCYEMAEVSDHEDSNGHKDSSIE